MPGSKQRPRHPSQEHPSSLGAWKAVPVEPAQLDGQGSKVSGQMRTESGPGYFLFPTSRQKMNHDFVNNDFLQEPVP